jgi:hypothetical protein
MMTVRNMLALPVLRIIAPAFDFDASGSFQPAEKSKILSRNIIHIVATILPYPWSRPAPTEGV